MSFHFKTKAKAQLELKQFESYHIITKRVNSI